MTKKLQWCGIRYAADLVPENGFKRFGRALLGMKQKPNLGGVFKMLPVGEVIERDCAIVEVATWEAWCKTDAPVTGIGKGETRDEVLFQEVLQLFRDGQLLDAQRMGDVLLPAFLRTTDRFGVTDFHNKSLTELLALPFGISLPEAHDLKGVSGTMNTAARFSRKRNGSVKMAHAITGEEVRGEWDWTGNLIAYRDPQGFTDLHGIPIPPVTRVA